MTEKEKLSLISQFAGALLAVLGEDPQDALDSILLLAEQSPDFLESNKNVFRERLFDLKQLRDSKAAQQERGLIHVQNLMMNVDISNKGFVAYTSIDALASVMRRAGWTSAEVTEAITAIQKSSGVIKNVL